MERGVLIVGGGPAGAVCATALARRGVAVTVLEARAFPRVKACGEFLSPAVHGLLADYLPAAVLRHAGARVVERLRVLVGLGVQPSGGLRERLVAEWAFPRRGQGSGFRVQDSAVRGQRSEVGGPAPLEASDQEPESQNLQPMSLSRATLDTLLLEGARAAGAEVRQPVTVRAVRYYDDHVEARLDDGVLRGAVVVHADGCGRHDPAGSVPCQRGVVALKCHLRLEPPLGAVLEMRGFGLALAAEGERARLARGYFGLIEVERGLATVAMVADAALVRAFHGDHDRLLAAAWPGAAGARREGPWHSCPVAESAYVAPGHPRSFRLGNAAGAVEPVAGEGIGLALWSGDWLGRRLRADAGADAARAALQRELARAYRRRLRYRRPTARALAALLRRPGLLAAAAPLLTGHPQWVLSPAYRLTGKP